MTGVSEISGPKYVLGPRVVGKLSFRQFQVIWEGGEQFTGYCRHEHCPAAPQRVERELLPCSGSSAGSGLVDRRTQDAPPPSLPALLPPTSSYPPSIPGPGVIGLSKQEKMH